MNHTNVIVCLCLVLLAGCLREPPTVSLLPDLSGEWINLSPSESYSITVMEDQFGLSGTGTCHADFGTFGVTVSGSRRGKEVMLSCIYPQGMATNSFRCRIVAATPLGSTTNCPVLWDETRKVVFYRKQDLDLCSKGIALPNK